MVKLTVSAPNRYPAMEEKTTLTDNLILVISAKFVIIPEETEVERLLDNTIYFYGAKIRYTHLFLQLKWYIISCVMVLFIKFTPLKNLYHDTYILTFNFFFSFKQPSYFFSK